MALHDDKPVLMPSEVSTRVGFFDRFAGHASHVASRAVFFAFCVALVVIWAPSVLQNSHTRTDQAIQHKLNAPPTAWPG